MKRVKSIGAVALAMGLAALWAGSVQAQLTKIHVGYSAISGDQLPALHSDRPDVRLAAIPRSKKERRHAQEGVTIRCDLVSSNGLGACPA
jgi:hypothetical protein